VVGHTAQELWNSAEREVEAAWETHPGLRMRIHDEFEAFDVQVDLLAEKLRLHDLLDPLWVRIARHEIGEKPELGFDKNNPRILQYLATFSDLSSIPFSKQHPEIMMGNVDETAWCACFVNWCLLKAGMPRGPSARAQDWLDYGTELDKPGVGAITILHHNSDKSTSETTPSGYHVAFYLSGSGSNITLLGGNQSHSVCTKPFNTKPFKWEILGYRWPDPKAEKHASK